MHSRELLILIAATFLSFLGLLLPHVWPLTILGVAGFYILVSFTASRKRALIYGLVWGLGASAGGVWWFFDTLPISWIAVPSGPIEWYLVGIVFLLTVIALTLPFVLFTLILRSVAYRAWCTPLWFALLFTCLEVVRMYSFSLFFLSPASFLGPDFSIAALGYVLIESSLLRPVGQFGILGLSLLLALLGACVGEVAHRQAFTAKLIPSSIALSLLVLFSHSLLPALDAKEFIRVALISTHEPAGTFTNHTLLTNMLEQAAQTGAEIVALPEGLSLALTHTKDERLTFYERVFPHETLIISSSVVQDPEQNERAVLLYESSTQGVLEEHTKIFFVPVGEFLPPLVAFFITPAGGTTIAGYESYISGKQVYGQELESVSFKNMQVGALMCSELLSPRLYWHLYTGEKTDVLINIANNSWFHGSHLLHTRLTQIARTHALSTRQYVLVASNSTPSYAASPHGVLVAESSWETESVLVVEVPTR